MQAPPCEPIWGIHWIWKLQEVYMYQANQHDYSWRIYFQRWDLNNLTVTPEWLEIRAFHALEHLELILTLTTCTLSRNMWQSISICAQKTSVKIVSYISSLRRGKDSVSPEPTEHSFLFLTFWFTLEYSWWIMLLVSGVEQSEHSHERASALYSEDWVPWV